jgi:hypothetical protein
MLSGNTATGRAIWPVLPGAPAAPLGLRSFAGLSDPAATRLHALVQLDAAFGSKKQLSLLKICAHLVSQELYAIIAHISSGVRPGT